MSLTLSGGTVLTRDEGLAPIDLLLEDGVMALGRAGKRRFDARDCLVLPGIVDLHGDAFERQIQPRPGVDFPVPLALRDTEAQLLANGITTAFHGITLSWEPGLRSVQAWRTLLDALAAEDHVCDMRVHMRWEAFNLDALDQAIADIEAGRVHLLAFNDHTPEILERLDRPAAAAKYADRAGLSREQFIALAQATAARADAVPEAQRRIAAAAAAAGLPMASHDDATVAERDHFRALGAAICEFPMALEVGQAARAAQDWVVMGSPNVVRGRSHLGWASARALAEAGVCRILSSDYFYPAMLRAAFILGEGPIGLPAAWAMISTNPAQAAHLDDRGQIAEGKRADLVVVRDQRVIATFVRGHPAHLTMEGAARING